MKTSVLVLLFFASVCSASDRIIFKDDSKKPTKQLIFHDEDKASKDKKPDTRSFGIFHGHGVGSNTGEFQFGIPINHHGHQESHHHGAVVHPAHTNGPTHGGFPNQGAVPLVPALDSLTAAIGGNANNLPVSGGCRFWCRTPRGQAYCCEDVNQAQSLVFTKAGVCPPVRDFCPPVRSHVGPPAPCSNDGSCIGVDKCCFDTCLNQHTCKAPQGVGR